MLLAYTLLKKNKIYLSNSLLFTAEIILIYHGISLELIKHN